MQEEHTLGSNQSSMWCRCHLCEISTPTVTYQDVCCTAWYRLPPRGQRTWNIMKNCVWAKWSRITLKFLWLGKDFRQCTDAWLKSRG